MRKKKISLLCPYLIHGGAEKQFNYLMEALLDCEKFDCSVYILKASKKEIDDLLKRYSDKPIRVHHFNVEPKDQRFRLILLNIYLFVQLLIRGYDVIYYYTIYFYPLSFLNLFSKKVVYSERILSSQTRNRKPLFKLISFISAVVVNSESLYEFFQQIHGNTVIIKNRVDSIKYALKTKQGLDIALISRVSPEKNLEYVFQNLEFTATVNVYYGGLDKNYQSNLIKEADENRKITVNWKGRRKIEEIYSENDIIIHASLAEGSPNVLLEAMASKKTCFASRILENENTGINDFFLFDLNDNGTDLNTKLEMWLGKSELEKEELLEFNLQKSRIFNKESFEEATVRFFRNV